VSRRHLSICLKVSRRHLSIAISLLIGITKMVASFAYSEAFIPILL
jgi:hypothetical protein